MAARLQLQERHDWNEGAPQSRLGAVHLAVELIDQSRQPRQPAAALLERGSPKSFIKRRVEF